MSRMKTTRNTLLAGAAIVALSIGNAQAQDYLPDGTGLWLSFEGRYMAATGTKVPYSANSNSAGTTLIDLDQVGIHRAWSGRIGVGYRFDNAWDISGSYTGLRSKKKHGSVPYNNCSRYPVAGLYRSCYDSSAVTVKQQMDVGDFEVGYNMGLGSRTQLRLHAGLRVVSWRQSVDIDSRYINFPSHASSNQILDNNDYSFIGAGPRLGVAATFELARFGNQTLSITGDLAGSIAIGSARSRYRTRAVSPIGSSAAYYDDGYDDTETRAIYNMDTSVVLNYGFPIGSMRGTIGLGYRFEGWWRLNNTRGADPTKASIGGSANEPFSNIVVGKNAGNQFFHGPIVRFVLNF